MAVEVNIVYDHNRGLDEAKRRVTVAYAAIAKKYHIHGTWRDATTYAIAKPVEGTFTVSQTQVRVSLRLGILMSSLKDQIEKGIKAELTAALA
jgi:putative polyhydroxyalkanoate system protein